MMYDRKESSKKAALWRTAENFSFIFDFSMISHIISRKYFLQHHETPQNQSR